MNQELHNLVHLMARLRAPDGCPWDRQQTHESLKSYLLEETYEVLEAIDTGTSGALKEELGDVLLQVIFHAQIASERSDFTFDDIAQHLAQKLIRRHPHVFNTQVAGNTIENVEEVTHRWENIKSQERGGTGKSDSLLEGIPKASPALQRAYQVQKRAARGGFDWKSTPPVLNKLREEFDELFIATSQAVTSDAHQHTSDNQHRQSHENIEAELGDVLFSFVNVARFLKINPEEALRKATNRFMSRFAHVEQRTRQEGRSLQDCSEAELDQWWEEAKIEEARIQERTAAEEQDKPSPNTL